MSCYYNYAKETTIFIPNTSESNGVIYYEIKVKVKNVEWQVQRRYRDFDELHEKLVNEQTVAKNLLPPKKVIGNKQPAFIEQRRKDLEEYLQKLLGLLRITMPRELVEFLDMNKYDIIYLLQDLAQYCVESGDNILTLGKEFAFSVLELYAISERMSLPCPSSDNKENLDFSHVLDFCSQLESISITPTKTSCDTGKDYNLVDVPIGRSNLIPKNLNFHLNAFRNLQVLKIYGISTENISDVAILKTTLKSFYVHNTTITKINQILMCDNIHKPDDIVAVTTDWKQIEYLNFSGNLLVKIDSSIHLAPKVQTLIMDQNRIKTINNLNALSELRSLSLCENLIQDCIGWHTELGNLVTLNLSQNKLKNVTGLKKLYSLVYLDLSCNQIEDLDEVENMASLPLLEHLRLTGNPLAGSVDYRSRVLARFNDRASEIYLDNEKGSSRELDMALVLSALQKSNRKIDIKSS